MPFFALDYDDVLDGELIKQKWRLGRDNQLSSLGCVLDQLTKKYEEQINELFKAKEAELIEV